MTVEHNGVKLEIVVGSHVYMESGDGEVVFRDWGELSEDVRGELWIHCALLKRLSALSEECIQKCL